MADGKLTKVGALWLKEKAGRKYMSGKLDTAIPAGAQIFVYKNDHKKEDKHPDYTLHAIMPEESAEQPYRKPSTNQASEAYQEDIPF
jgi:uncharacterized protein (DUF736 family)